MRAELELGLGFKLDPFVEELTFRMPTPDEAGASACQKACPSSASCAPSTSIRGRPSR